MKTVHLVWPANSQKEMEDLVAIFDTPSLVNAFIHRNPEFEGLYEVEEREINPPFLLSSEPPFLVILDPGKTESPNIIRIRTFDDERNIQHDPISKYDGAFFMYLFAKDESDALAKASQKLLELQQTGIWDDIKDES